MQVKLLRLIESATFRRVGGTETRKASFRLIAATHKPLRQMVADGRFREDLYYRISAFPITLPPLRARSADIPLLVESILRRGDASHRLQVSPEAIAALQRHAWPGNIRELRNVLDRARLLADDGIVRPEHCFDAQPGVPRDVGPTTASMPEPPADDARLREIVAGFQGTRRALAAQLRLSERTLYRRLKALGLG